MKCPECNHEQKRGKAGMICQSCRYQFAFDPKRDRFRRQKLTDARFQAILYAASAGNTLYYTPNQLYAVACSRFRKAQVFSFAVAILLGVLSVIFGVVISFVIPVILLAILLTTYITMKRKRLKRSAWNAHLARWEEAGKTLPWLLREPALQEPPPDWDEPDIYDYGAVGILLCQHDRVVDWLVLNKLPAELQLVVLSETGYPTYLLPIITCLLETHPDLPVYLLHDASTVGGRMLSRVETAAHMSLAGHPVFTLGIHPTETEQLPGRVALPKDALTERQAVDTLPYQSLVSLMTAAIATTPPQTLADVWDTRHTGGSEFIYVGVGDFG